MAIRPALAAARDIYLPEFSDKLQYHRLLTTNNRMCLTAGEVEREYYSAGALQHGIGMSDGRRRYVDDAGRDSLDYHDADAAAEPRRR